MWSVPTRGPVSVADDSSTSTANSFLKVLFLGGFWLIFVFRIRRRGCLCIGMFEGRFSE